MSEPTVKEFLSVYAEQTPNPETMKFVFNRMILPGESAEFLEKANSAASPLAMQLFEFSFVQGVFIMNNFVTITRSPGMEWPDIIPIVKEFLIAFVDSGEPVLLQTVATQVSAGDNIVVAKILEILDTYIKPAVE